MNNKYSRKNVFDSEGNLLPIEERTFTTTEGYELVFIDGGSKKSHVTAKIGDYIFLVEPHKAKLGNVKNPFHHSVYGHGYFGVGEHSFVKDPKAYKSWAGIMERVYCPKLHLKRPTYKDVTVCEEWHNFQNFAKWFYEESNYQDGWHLDKDLMSNSEKVYSPETCIFIPNALNSFIANRYVNNKSGYVGVCWDKEASRWAAAIKLVNTGKTIKLGRFTTPEDASNAYEIARSIEANVWANRMSGILPEAAINSIK